MNPVQYPSTGRKKEASVPKQPRLTPILSRAQVTKLSVTPVTTQGSPDTKVDRAVLNRIRKALDRANHPGTPQAEARAAFENASRYMSIHNVTYAQPLSQEASATQKQHAGQSVVAITRADGSEKAVAEQEWVSSVAYAMSLFFDCKYFCNHFKLKYPRIEFRFYGISENTAAAAMAFEAAYNLISEWTRSEKGVTARKSYGIGAGHELMRKAEKKREREMKQAMRAEKKAAKQAAAAHAEQVQGSGPTSSVEDTESENDDLSSYAQLDHSVGLEMDLLLTPWTSPSPRGAHPTH